MLVIKSSVEKRIYYIYPHSMLYNTFLNTTTDWQSPQIKVLADSTLEALCKADQMIDFELYKEIEDFYGI